jgi:hypothetical protein
MGDQIIGIYLIPVITQVLAARGSSNHFAAVNHSRGTGLMKCFRVCKGLPNAGR